VLSVNRRAALMSILITLALFALVAGIMLALGSVPSRAAFDSKLYHLPTIEQFSRSWPALDPWDYLSATTPGYHWLLAGVMKVSGSLTLVLAANAVMSAVFFALAAWLIARLATPMDAAGNVNGRSISSLVLPTLLCLPLLANNYLLMPGVALLPDVAGWLGVLAMISLALRSGSTGMTLLAGGLILLATVLTRQVHVWIGGLLLLALWMPVQDTGRRAGEGSRFARAGLGILACVPAALVLVLFVRYWDGLVPPRFQGQYPPRGVRDMLLSPAPAFILAVAGAIGVFFIGFWWQGLARMWREHRAVLVLAILASAAVALIPPTTFDYLAGRRTGVWNLAERFPSIAGRTSVLILGLAILGGATLVGFATLLERRTRLILLAALLGYAIVMTASAEVWQRYVEPFVLIVLTLMSAAVLSRGEASRGRAISRVAGVTLLTIACVGVTVRTFQAGVESWSDPAPAPMDANHIGPPPPVVLEAPVKPTGKTFW
jgi:hypothetical protein